MCAIAHNPASRVRAQCVGLSSPYGVFTGRPSGRDDPGNERPDAAAVGSCVLVRREAIGGSRQRAVRVHAIRGMALRRSARTLGMAGLEAWRLAGTSGEFGRLVMTAALQRSLASSKVVASCPLTRVELAAGPKALPLVGSPSPRRRLPWLEEPCQAAPGGPRGIVVRTLD